MHALNGAIKGTAVHAYNVVEERLDKHPKANKWADPLPIPPDVTKRIRNGNYGFYDPTLNAYFCHFASDSTDDGTMSVYRYRNAAK